MAANGSRDASISQTFARTNFSNDGNAGAILITPAQRSALEQIRDNNLALYAQAQRSFTIRRDAGEEFLE